jgi:ABC-type multidrug transport system fused ATPase/permease subunit/CRP-like cAMP-binding protein
MDKSIFKYVFRYSKPEQLILLAITLVSFPTFYFSYDLPKIIINKAINATKDDFPITLLGFEFEQIPFLLFLCVVFVFIVLINGGFKFWINVYRGTMAERVLRRLRYQLIKQIMRFPLPHFRRISQGEIISMLVAETQPLGGFFGEAYSLPAFQGGQLLVLLAFIFVQDPLIGVAAIALYPVQMYLIPRIQKRVNVHAKARVRTVRKLSERLGEVIAGASDIHAHGTANFELADFTERLGTIFVIRVKIFKLKFFIKFLNNFIAQLTPFFFYSIGGYLVIMGDMTFGSLVAVIGAYKDLAPPWKELLGYYQRMEDARIKFDQLVEQFEPAGMMDEKLLDGESETIAIEDGLEARNATLEEEEGERVISAATFTLGADEHVTVSGASGGGKSDLARLLARQVAVSSGQIVIGGQDLSALSDETIGSYLSYVDQDTYISSGSFRDNLFYGLKRRPNDIEGDDDEARAAREQRLSESLKAGNNPHDIDADWIDYDAAGATDAKGLTERAMNVLSIVGLEEDVFQFGLRRVIKPDAYPELVEGVLKARGSIAKMLLTPGLSNLVETFDKKKFNSHASVAENILFGTPVGAEFDVDDLGKNPYVREVLEEVGLRDDFIEIGRATAVLMIDLFRDLPPGHELMDRFSFIDADDLPGFQKILKQAESDGVDSLDEEDRTKLSDLPFKLIPSRHRLDQITGEVQDRILEARQVFADKLPEELRPSIEFFEHSNYNAASSIQDNILFGKMADNRSESVARIGEIMADTINELGLRWAVLDVGLDFDVGIAGKRLSGAQRQRLSIARSLMKRPRIMIVNEAVSSLDAAAQGEILKGVKSEMAGRGLVWIDGAATEKATFDRVLTVDRGHVHDETAGAPGPVAEVPRPPAEEAVASGGLGEETDVLTRIPFFAGVDRSRLKLLAFTSERQVFQPGEALFQQGDKGESAYVVLDGTYDVSVETSDGPRTVSTGGKGNLLGELALLSDVPRTATILAAEQLSVLRIVNDIFIDLVMENKAVAANVMRIISTRLADTMRDLSGQSPEYDETTGLPKRDLFIHRARLAINEDNRRGKKSVLIVIRFKDLDKIEAEHGAEVRAEFTRSLSGRLKGSFRHSDTIGHLDGFGFGIVACAGQSDANAEVIVEKLTEVLAAPVAIEPQQLELDGGAAIENYALTEENLKKATGAD